MNIPIPKIDPGRVANPIQLLAALLSAMAVLVVSFLTAAGFIRDPAWAFGTLVVTAVLNIPVFIGILFLMLTKFRHVLVGDEHYVRWLDRERQRFRSFRPRRQGEDPLTPADTALDANVVAPEERRRGLYLENEGLFLTTGGYLPRRTRLHT